MELKKIIKELEGYKEFREWRKKNKDSFLSYLFRIIPSQDNWQIGYYSKPKDSVTSFKFVDNRLDIMPDQEVFKKEDSIVIELNLERVKIPLENALNIANKIRTVKYKLDSNKIIVLLQRLDIGQVWNITFVTNTLSTLNIKLSSSSGKVLNEDLIHLVSYKGG